MTPGPRRPNVEPSQLQGRLEVYERILPRLGAASGALSVALIFGLSSTGSDAQVVIALELIGLLLLIPFLSYLWSILRAAEGPAGWLSATALGAGLVGVTTKFGSIAPGWAARDFEDATAMHKALERMNEVAFIAQMLPDGMMLAAIAIVTLKFGALPRWLGWLAARGSSLQNRSVTIGERATSPRARSPARPGGTVVRVQVPEAPLPVAYFESPIGPPVGAFGASP
ncbi:MAG: hypothetical protein ACRDM0_18370 [Thermoleophilaceae bacterium]